MARERKTPPPTGSGPVTQSASTAASVSIAEYKNLLQTLRTLNADKDVIETAERVVRDREARLAGQE
jgi:hypothetical protein